MPGIRVKKPYRPDNRKAGASVTNPDADKQICEEAQRLFEARIDEVPDWVWETDLNAVVTYTNHTVEGVLGYEPREVLGRSSLDSFASEDRLRIRGLIEHAVKTGHVEQNVIAHARRKDGEMRTLEINARAMRNEEGKLIGFRGVTRDITNRKTAEQALRDSEEKRRQRLEELVEARTSELRAANRLLRREIAERKQAEEELQRYRDHLEELAAQRTQELTATNEQLQREIAERRQVQERLERLGRLKEQLLGPAALNDKLKLITNAVVDILGADFARLWTVAKGDLCQKGCRHAEVTEDQHACRDRSRCLHLVASSGRYTNTDGSHRRVPFGAYKIGLIASGELVKFVTNDVAHDPHVHNHEWARRLGLVSFAGHRIISPEEAPVGVLALFSKQPITADEEAMLDDLASAASQVIVAGTATEALRESEETYRNLVETTDTGYLIVDTQGRVVDANAEYVKLTGRQSLEEICRHSVLEWTADYDLDRNAGEIKKCAETGKVRNLIIDYVWPDGTIVPIEIDATVTEIRGEPRILTLCRDIAERKNVEQALAETEAQKRQFYRDTILSVTDGKLDICDPPEIRPYLSRAEIRIRVSAPAEVSPARREIERYCRDRGAAPERLDLFMIGVGEAITNAVKHAEAGRVYAGVIDGSVWVGVVDRGRGISSLILPKATLLRGYSTKPSLGLGYTIMLEIADKILLKTGERGTIVILVRQIVEPEVEVTSAQLPDTWDSIPV